MIYIRIMSKMELTRDYSLFFYMSNNDWMMKDVSSFHGTYAQAKVKATELMKINGTTECWIRTARKGGRVVGKVRL